MAATQARNTSQVSGTFYALPVKAGVKIFAGTLVAIDATGHAIPAKTAADLTAAGRAEDTVDNATGADGDTVITAERGAFQWDNDASSPVTQADVGKECYMLDDETVTANATGTSVAGRVLQVNSNGVWVETL